MNIGCLTYEYPPIGGGGSTTIHAINLELSQMGYDINVLTTGFKNIPAGEDRGNIHVKRLYCNRKQRFVASLSSMYFYALSSTHYSLKYYNDSDIIHSYFVVPSGIPGYFMKKIRKKPFVVTIFGGDIYDPTRSNLQRKIVNSIAVKKILASADVVTTISHDLVGRIKGICDVDVELIHCGVNTKKFHPGKNIFELKKELGSDTEKMQILAVGRLVERKRFDILLFAMEEVLKEYPNVMLNIIGEGPEKEKLERIIDKFGMQNNVSLIGFVNEGKLIKFYQACDIFAISSLHEGQCCTILEAMSCGKPIVATNVGGIPDSVIEGYNGLLVQPDDPQKMASALLSIIEDEYLRANMAKNSRNRCINKFDWEIIAKQTSKIYSELV